MVTSTSIMKDGRRTKEAAPTNSRLHDRVSYSRAESGMCILPQRQQMPKGCTLCRFRRSHKSVDPKSQQVIEMCQGWLGNMKLAQSKKLRSLFKKEGRGLSVVREQWQARTQQSTLNLRQPPDLHKHRCKDEKHHRQRNS